MKKILSILILVCSFALISRAQTEAVASFKSATNGNPLCPYLFTADPTAVEHDGRLYVYGTNDTEEYIARGGQGNTYAAIRTLTILSTDDMVNWTYHGQIPVGELCGSWLVSSWAPSVVSRVESDGKTHFLKADVPLRKIFGYATGVRSISKGTALYSMKLLGYKPATL